MNKLFCILFTLTLTFGISSCSSDDDNDTDQYAWNGDWNNPEDPNYKPNGYNPIVGKWMYTPKTGATPKLLEFTSDFHVKRYDLVSLPKTWEQWDDKEYLINNTAYKTGVAIITYYWLDSKNNTLTTRNGQSGDLVVWEKYYE